MLIALFSMMLAQGAVWYCAFFYAQVFIERMIKVAPATVNLLMIAVVVASAPLYVLFGWLSDKVGRKWVMTLGMALATAALFPGFHLITSLANPALAAAQAATPVVVAADPATCSVQFDPVGKAKFVSACDIAKSVLATAGRQLPQRRAARRARRRWCKVGGHGGDGRRTGGAMTAGALAITKATDAAQIKAALKAGGYPEKADAAAGEHRGRVLRAAAVHRRRHRPLRPAGGLPGGAVPHPRALHGAEPALPHRHRLGRRLPARHGLRHGRQLSGDIYFGLWYPVIGGAVAVLVAALLLPETRGRDLDA